MATPLAYVYARNVLVLNSARPDKAAFAAFLEWAKTRYRRVMFVGGGGTDLLSHRYAIKAVSSTRFQVPEYESSLNAYPRAIRRKEFEFSVYEFAAPEALTPEGRWFDLDIGVNDDVHVLRFHAKEDADGRTFRWSRPTSYVSVTTISPDSRELILVLGDGGRPPARTGGEGRRSFFTTSRSDRSSSAEDSRRIRCGSRPNCAASRRQRRRLGGAPTGDRDLENPHASSGSGDDRALGVMVDRVTIK